MTDWLRVQLGKVEASIRAREQAERVWREGSAAAWSAVGCKLTKEQRLKKSEMERRIVVKLLMESEMFKAVISRLEVIYGLGGDRETTKGEIIMSTKQQEATPGVGDTKWTREHPVTVAVNLLNRWAKHPESPDVPPGAAGALTDAVAEVIQREREANSAPELYEACQRILNASYSQDPQAWSDAIDVVRAALAKAEGKSV